MAKSNAGSDGNSGLDGNSKSDFNSNINISAIAAEDARAALLEDIGAGDLSAQLLSAADTLPRQGVLYCRESAVLCGRLWFEQCFLQLDAKAKFHWQVAESEEMQPDGVVCKVHARVDALLTGERSALNFLQTLSATATVASRLCRLVQGKVAIVDTRKTIPKLRIAQKYAAKTGGAQNHRLGLFDEILIKENHIAAIGGIDQALQKAAQHARSEHIQIEVRDLSELEQAVNAGATRILLDNFTLADLRQAGQTYAERAELEASGNITENNLQEIADTGVHRISIGALTKNIDAVDFSFMTGSLPASASKSD